MNNRMSFAPNNQTQNDMFSLSSQSQCNDEDFGMNPKKKVELDDDDSEGCDLFNIPDRPKNSSNKPQKRYEEDNMSSLVSDDNDDDEDMLKYLKRKEPQLEAQNNQPKVEPPKSNTLDKSNKAENSKADIGDRSANKTNSSFASPFQLSKNEKHEVNSSDSFGEPPTKEVKNSGPSMPFKSVRLLF